MQLADCLGKLILYCGGGLGNQLFEYAAGLYFQKKFGRTLEVVKPIDRHANWNGYPRPFQLSEFRVAAKIRSAGLVDRIFFSSNPRVKELQGLIGSVLGVHRLEEPAAHRFHSELEDGPRNRTTFLVGNWQAARYVEAVETELRVELAFAAPPQARNEEYAAKIRSLYCPVSIHLRLGDYALIRHSTGGGREPVSMVLSAAYYERAIEALTAQFQQYTLVVFSDEQAHARQLLEGRRECLFVEGNDAATGFEDLRLMSLCKHHIIANSSFSWWGAWLNPDPAKRIFAPKYWGNTLNSCFPDLYPAGWTIIDNL